MLHQFIEALSGALFAIALIALEKLLPFPAPYNILVACIVGAIGFAVFFGIFWRFRHSRMLRRLTDELHSFEGDWLEEWFDGEKPRYSIATIRFDNKAKQYLLAGNAYDQDGKWLARWASHHLFYDRPSGRLVHVWDGFHDGKATFGATFFYVDIQNDRSGRGFFIDERPGDLRHFDVTYERLVDDTGTKLWQTNPKAWVKQRHAAAIQSAS